MEHLFSPQQEKSSYLHQVKCFAPSSLCFLFMYFFSFLISGDCVHDKTNHSNVTQCITSIYLKGKVAVSFGNDLLLDTDESKSTSLCCSQWCVLVFVC